MYITGQFNDWDLEEMTANLPTSSVESGAEATTQIPSHEKVGKLKYTYSRQVKGGQIYNFYLIVNGVMTVDPNQKMTQN